MDEEVKSKSYQQKRKSRKWLIAGFAVLIFIVLGAGGGLLVYKKYKDTSPFTGKVQRSLSFPVYYPATLPSGFSVDRKSISTSADVLTYSIRYQGEKYLAVTVQALPKDFDIESLSGNQEFTAPYGKAYIVDFDSRTTGSLVTNTTWVILNAPETMGVEQMKAILNSLQPLSGNSN